MKYSVIHQPQIIIIYFVQLISSKWENFLKSSELCKCYKSYANEQFFANRLCVRKLGQLTLSFTGSWNLTGLNLIFIMYNRNSRLLEIATLL